MSQGQTGRDGSPQAVSAWLEHEIQVQPQDTDYAGVVWHGAYLRWMEAGRIAALREAGVEFADLVNLGCDLPVIELSIRYHQPLTMGEIAVVRSRLVRMAKVRLHWDQWIQCPDTGTSYVKAQVTLAPVNRDQGRVMRKLPPIMQAALKQLTELPGDR